MIEDRLLKNLITLEHVMTCACPRRVTRVLINIPELQNER